MKVRVQRSAIAAAAIAIAVAALLVYLLGSEPAVSTTGSADQAPAETDGVVTAEVLSAFDSAETGTADTPDASDAETPEGGSASLQVAPQVTDDTNVKIGDFVWSDTNEDGIQDEGEPGIPNVQVTLLKFNRLVKQDDFVAKTVTGPDGEYEFLVPSGNYVLKFFAPPRATFSGPFAERSGLKDSDVGADGRSSTISVEVDKPDLSIDAGIIEFRPSIDIQKSTNGVDADTGSGPKLDVGSTVTFTYLVTNTGNVPLTDIVVTDNKGLTVTCSRGDLVVGASKSCTASAIVIEGPYLSVGKVVAFPTGSDEDDLQPVIDEDPSNHVGVIPFVPAPSIDLETYTNGEDADEGTGPALIVGKNATFTYVVENTGNVDLINVTITDDILDGVCAIKPLAPGDRSECEAIVKVTEGQYVNVALVEALAISPKGVELETVTDEDPSHHIGVPAGPVCATNIHGPRMYSGGTVIDETPYVAAAGSTIYIVTSEPGESPDQSNEQVYVKVGHELYGPTPAGLGSLEVLVKDTGPVTILHYSEVDNDTTGSNSVEYDWCGTDLTIPPVHTCPSALSGPRMYKGGIVSWDTELNATPGSTISITTSEPGSSPDQPNEQLYVIVGDEQFGPTPNEHTTTTFEVGTGGRVVVQHYSVINLDSRGANSVEMKLCGTGLYKPK